LIATRTNERYWRQRDAGDHAALAQWFGALSDAELTTFCALLGRVIDDLSRGGPRQPQDDK
jgi:hypothetical protein